MLVCTGKCCQGVDFVAKAHISYTHDWSKIVQHATANCAGLQLSVVSVQRNDVCCMAAFGMNYSPDVLKDPLVLMLSGTILNRLLISEWCAQ